MKIDRKKFKLYAVTDRKCLKHGTLPQAVEQVIKNGASFVQLREKEEQDDTLQTALEIREITKKYNVPFVIDDNVELALKVGADGVHIGQNDMPLSQARQLLGDDKIIGVTCRNLNQAIEAEKGGADYLGIGALFATSTKNDTERMSAETAKLITSSVNIPIVGIAGINHDNVHLLKDYGLDGIAVVSALFGADDPGEAAKNMIDIIDELEVI